LRLGSDRIRLPKALEPGRGEAIDTFSGAEQGGGDRGVRVGVAAERDDSPQLRLDVTGADERLERGAGREQTEPLIGPVDRARTAHRLDQELGLLAALEVLDRGERGAGRIA